MALACVDVVLDQVFLGAHRLHQPGRLRRRNDLVGVAMEHQQRDTDRGGVGDRRPCSVPVLGNRQLADETVEIARLEAMGGLRELQEVGHAVHAHRCPNETTVLRADQEDGEAARAATDHRDPGRIAPSTLAGGADAGRGVVDVEHTP